MARIFTTPAAEQAAKKWLSIITVAAGLRTDPNMGNVGDTNFKTYATTICDELVNRNFDNINASIRRISYYGIHMGGKTRHLKPEQIAKCIVYMAEQVQLYWDDTVRTPYEVDEFKKTILGEAVYTYGRYISAIQDKPAKAARSNAGSAGSGGNAGTGNSGNNQPKNGYKQSGGQSANARDLKGNPGEKVYADTAYIYRIIGDTTSSKNIPNVFVNPLSSSGASGSTNKVKFSSGNGYSDCTCFFDNPNDADAFLNKLIQNNRIPADVTNPRVVKGKADPNGYFIVGTEFGDCAISAKKLNEALNEAVSEEPSRQVSWEKATEGYTKKELDELHTWMRRD